MRLFIVHRLITFYNYFSATDGVSGFRAMKCYNFSSFANFPSDTFEKLPQFYVVMLEKKYDCEINFIFHFPIKAT